MSIEEQTRQKQLSVEQAVREQQAFEDRLREFLSIASSMTNQELEIALARLADMIQTTKGQPEPIRAKGTILNIYYQLRAAGLKRQSTLARIKWNVKAGVYIGEFGEFLIGQLSSYALPQLPMGGASPYSSEDSFHSRIRLLAP